MMSSSSPLPAALEDLVEKGLHAQRSGALERAAEHYLELLQIAPNNFDGLQLLGLVRVQGGELAEGISLLSRAVEINPRELAVLNNLGNALREAGLFRQAVEAFHRALKIEPMNVIALTNLALTLLLVGEVRFAAKCIERAAGREPENAAVLYATGHLMQAMGRPHAAIEAYRRAIARGKTGHEVQLPLGLALQDIGDESAAWDAFGAAEQERPTLTNRLLRAYAGLQCAHWQSFAEDAAAFDGAPDGEPLEPLRLLHFPAAGANLRRHVERFAQGCVARGNSLTQPNAPLVAALTRLRIRVAYLSPDFRNHPVGMLVAGMLREHDRSRFEIYGYGWGPPDISGTRERIAAACDRFQDVSALTDQALVARLRADEIDIAVDLAGHTAENRISVFAARIAPVQVNWLGYPGTTGGTLHDYICADACIIPPGSEGEFSERVVRLPHTYLPYDRTLPVSVKQKRRAYGLPDEAIVLACFGQARKINPPVFAAWMHVLREVPEAVLWLSTTKFAPTMGNLRREAEERGIAPERIVFAERAPSHADHLARYRTVDIALDTFPYGSHSTAADALWAGCPLVSLAGSSFVSRVSGSVIQAAGLPELITRTVEEYRALVLALATDPARRQELRARLEAQRLSCPLFDTTRFVRGLERAFLTMQERRLMGLPAAAFDVPDLDPITDRSQVPQRPVPLSYEGRHRLMALVAQGFELQKSGQTPEAAGRFERALALDPNCFDALQLLGLLRFRAGDLETGIDLLTRASSLQPDHAPTLNNLGNALREAGRLEDAIEAYARAARTPDPPALSWQNLGSALIQRGDLQGAFAAYSRACALDPDLLAARAARASLGQALAVWSHLQQDVEILSTGTPPTAEPTVDPGSLLALPLSAATQRRYADSFALHLTGTAPRMEGPRANSKSGRRPLRVAYLSGDFREHAVGYLVAPVFEAHDRSRITPLGYSWGGAASDPVQTRIMRGVDHFRDISMFDDAGVRAQLEADGIDIAIDLMGYTTGARPSLFAARIAPVQVGWLGYPGTLGAGLLDYLIADEFILPARSEAHYAERVIRLPDTYLPYDRSRRIAAARSRGEYGLPETGLVLASLGPTRKITPWTLDIWLDVLERLPDSVLWLGNAAPTPLENLRAALRARGLAPERAVFAEPLRDNADHLARYRVADLALDTSPWGSHSTAADALWVGCPLVALVGETFASRVSGSVLRAAGLPELVTQDLEGYRDLVLALAQDDERRRALRERMADQRLTCPLFDISAFVSALEGAYETIWARHEA